MTGVQSELIPDIEMYFFVEKGMRVGGRYFLQC